MQQIAADKLQTPMSHSQRLQKIRTKKMGICVYEKANFAPQTAVQTFWPKWCKGAGCLSGATGRVVNVISLYFSVNKHAELLAKTTAK